MNIEVGAVEMYLYAVLNINTLIEIIIHFSECHDWRRTFELSIPIRKVKVEDETGNDFDYHKIKSKNELERISEYKINRYEIKHALHIFCQKNKKQYQYINREVSYEEYEEKCQGSILRCRVSDRDGQGETTSLFAFSCENCC